MKTKNLISKTLVFFLGLSTLSSVGFAKTTSQINTQQCFVFSLLSHQNQLENKLKIKELRFAFSSMKSSTDHMLYVDFGNSTAAEGRSFNIECTEKANQILDCQNAYGQFLIMLASDRPVMSFDFAYVSDIDEPEIAIKPLTQKPIKIQGEYIACPNPSWEENMLEELLN